MCLNSENPAPLGPSSTSFSSIPAGCEGAKGAARSEASRRWPGKAACFSRKRDNGKAELALVALAGIFREHGR